MNAGGIDIGATKIEARLYLEDADAPAFVQRIDTAKEPARLLEDVAALVVRLQAEAGAPVPVGVAVPGGIDPETGRVSAANLAVNGLSLSRELSARRGHGIGVWNDAAAFTLSEATGGAGAEAASVAGIILGSGVGAGFVAQRRPLPAFSGLAVEIGHLAAPPDLLERHGLKTLPCGCGRLGCLEIYASGRGLERLAEHLLGRAVRGEDIAGHPEGARVLVAWADFAGEALFGLHALLDPAVIVLGGGLSRLPGIEKRLEAALAERAIAGPRLPDIRLARFGDASGARGAAILAREAAGC